MKSENQKKLFTLLSFLVLIYLVLRAIYVPLVFDEIYTFFHYVRPTNLTPFNDYTAANNHLLNTNLTYLSYHIFGNYPLALRLPNVLSFFVFAFYVYKIGNEFIVNNIPRLGFYLVMLLTVNFVSFFALSRGYGLSFAFMMASIYYILKSYNALNSRCLFFSVVFMMLSLLANFATLLFVLISLLILGVLMLKNRKAYFNKVNIKYSVYSILIVIGTLFFVLKTLFKYKEQGQLYWGDLDGFWLTTVNSLYDLIFQIEDGSFLLDAFVITSSLLIIAMLFVKGFFKKENVFSYLIILNVIGILAMAFLLEVNYPVQRIGLHLFPLFIGTYCFSVNKITNKYVQAAFVLPLLAFPVFSSYNINLTTISCWEEDNLPYSFAHKVNAIEKGNNKTLSIYGEGVSGYCWAYQLDRENIKLPTVVESRQNEKRNYDYVIDLKENVQPFMHLYDSLDYNEHSTHYLLKRKQPTNKELVFEVEGEKNKVVEGNEFTELIRIDVDSLGVSSMLFNFDIRLISKVPSFQNWIVVSIDDVEKKENIAYRKIRMDWKKEWTAKDVLQQGIYVNELPKHKKLNVVMYLWNIKKENYTLLSAKAKAYKIIEDYTK